MQKRIYLIALVIAAIVSAESVKAQAGEQKFRAQIQKKKQEVADMQGRLDIQRQQRLAERIPPPPVTRNTNTKVPDKAGEGVLNGNGGNPANAAASGEQTKPKPTKKDPAKKEAP